MRRLLRGLLAIGLSLWAVPGWAGTPTDCPPIADPLLGKWCQSAMDHLNTLECLSADPNGSVLGTHGELKCANFSGCQRICMNTSTGPSKGTAWSCFCPGGTCPAGSDGYVQYNSSSSCGAEADLTWDQTNNRLGVGTNGLGDAQIHSALATDGDSVLLLLENSQTNTASSTNETAQLRFGLGGDNDVARIVSGKVGDYTSVSSTDDSYLAFSIDADGTSSELMRLVGISSALNSNGKSVKIGRTDNTIAAAALDIVAFNNTVDGHALRIQDFGQTLDMFRVYSDSRADFGDIDFSSSWQVSVLSGGQSDLVLQGGSNSFPANVKWSTTDGTTYTSMIRIKQIPSPLFTRSMQWLTTNLSSVQVESPFLEFNPVTEQVLTLAEGTILTDHRSYIFRPQTINGVAGGSTETITNAATVYISNAPSGSNITFTNDPYALWVDNGAVRFDGAMTFAGTATNTVSGNVLLQKAAPTVIYDVPTSGDTDFWVGVQDDAGSDNDDTYQIGTGITPGSNTQLTLTNAGALTVGTINTGNGAVELAAGQWTPTPNDIANLDASSSAAEGQYLRVGATVTGSVQMTVNPTLTATSTQTELDLPVASNFGATSDAAGTCAAPGIASQVAAITADAASDELEVRWIAGDVTAQEMDCAFSYQVL